MVMQRPLVAAVVAASACVALAGCGSGGRPSVSQIESGLNSSGGSHSAMEKKTMHCMATKLHDAKGVSDAALRAIANNSKGYKPSAAETKAAGRAMMACMKGDIGKVLGSLQSSQPSPK